MSFRPSGLAVVLTGLLTTVPSAEVVISEFAPAQSIQMPLP